jgi:hypothetical protein
MGKASRLYRREKDGLEMVVKAVSNLGNTLIAALIGFAFVLAELEGEEKLKVGGLHAAGGSLAEVASAGPVWWTPTAKAEAVVGIVLALRFAHGLELVHGGLNAGNALFDGGWRIHIADFSPMRRDGGLSEEGEGWMPRADVSAFAMFLFEIVAGVLCLRLPLR